MSNFQKMEPFSEAALAADWKWGCGGRSPPPGQTIFNIKLILSRLAGPNASERPAFANNRILQGLRNLTQTSRYRHTHMLCPVESEFYKGLHNNYHFRRFLVKMRIY